MDTKSQAHTRLRCWLIALSVALVVGVAGTGASAQAATVIDTTPQWQGFPVCNFGGDGGAATFGQVITAPSQDRTLDSFTFFVRDAFVPATLIFRGEVYEWDGVKAKAKVWESGPRRVVLEPHFSVFFETETFATGGARLDGGKQYVLFLTVSRDFEKLASPAFGCMGMLLSDGYAGGQFMSLNNRADVSQWTTVPWSPLPDGPTWDLAFTASFSRG